MKTFNTPKGTALPLLNLRGKDYLEVAQRLVWMREEHPDWGISTEIIERTKDSCLTKASITDSTGRLLSTGHKFEDAKGFGDFIEKSETGSIGRALALCGYGTQFTTDLEEGERLADSPVTRPTGPAKLAPITETAKIPHGMGGGQVTYPPMNNFVGNDPGDYTPTFGKYKGYKLKTISLAELKNYVSWLQSNAAKDKKPMSHSANEFVMAVDVFLESATTMQKEIKVKAEEPDFGPPPNFDNSDDIPF